MSMAALSRVGSFAALSGATLAILGQVLHPSIPDPASTQSLLETVTTSPPRRFWAHVVGIVAMVLMTVALVTIVLSLLTTSARSLALAALWSSIVSGASSS